jgi:protein-L-isoaspartate(D-aspartate) O-methyltransferase
MSRSRLQFERLRNEMVADQLQSRGVQSLAVLAAMRKVERENYLPAWQREHAYEDAPLQIEEGQTVSQPFTTASMLDALDLKATDHVLEIGTGSGYAAAVLAEIVHSVFTIERHERLALLAAERLRRDGYRRVHVRFGDGTQGWSEHAPFDAIVVAAGGPVVPPQLLHQLEIGGRLVIPVGSHGAQRLLRIVRRGDEEYDREDLGLVHFVPLIGANGWNGY